MGRKKTNHSEKLNLYSEKIRKSRQTLKQIQHLNKHSGNLNVCGDFYMGFFDGKNENSGPSSVPLGTFAM
jgi:hypothetical protein